MKSKEQQPLKKIKDEIYLKINLIANKGQRMLKIH